jgi:hypothetical protein
MFASDILLCVPAHATLFPYSDRPSDLPGRSRWETRVSRVTVPLFGAVESVALLCPCSERYISRVGAFAAPRRICIESSESSQHAKSE